MMTILMVMIIIVLLLGVKERHRCGFWSSTLSSFLSESIFWLYCMILVIFYYYYYYYSSPSIDRRLLFFTYRNGNLPHIFKRFLGFPLFISVSGRWGFTAQNWQKQCTTVTTTNKRTLKQGNNNNIILLLLGSIVYQTGNPTRRPES